MYARVIAALNEHTEGGAFQTWHFPCVGACMSDEHTTREHRHDRGGEHEQAAALDRHGLRHPARTRREIGIFWDVWALLDGGYDPHEIRDFLSWYCGDSHYFEAVAAGRTRLALDGTPTEPPTDEQCAFERQRLSHRSSARLVTDGIRLNDDAMGRSVSAG